MMWDEQDKAVFRGYMHNKHKKKIGLTLGVHRHGQLEARLGGLAGDVWQAVGLVHACER